jgi:hypothetical protein
LLRDLFRETAILANVLGVDDDLVAQLTSTAAKLPPFLVGAGGQLQEWLTGLYRLTMLRIANSLLHQTGTQRFAAFFVCVIL